jgi:hypothetical protein
MKHFASLVILLAVPGLAQQRSGLHARELFYTPPPDPAAQNAAAAAQTSKAPDPPKPAPAPTAKATPKQTTPSKSAVQAKTATPPSKGGNPVAGNPVDTHVVQTAIPLGLRYAMLKRDAQGNYQETDPDTNFKSGDRIRIQVDANTSGYLYVVMQGSSGTWRLLFPSPEVAGGSNAVHRGQSLQIPPGDRGQFVFDEQAGTEKLFLVLTRQPEPDLDKLIYAMGGASGAPVDQNAGRVIIAQATVRDAVVDRLRSQVQARDLVFEKVDTSSAAPAETPAGTHVENAAYVVNPSTAPDARLVVDVALRHK